MLTKTHGLIALCQIFVAISVLYLIVGLIKPRWAWLGEKVPNRQVIIGISLAMFMASWTGYSALRLKPREEIVAEQAQGAAATAVDPEVAKAMAESKPESKPAPAAPQAATVAPKAAEPKAATPAHAKPKEAKAEHKPEHKKAGPKKEKAEPKKTAPPQH